MNSMYFVIIYNNQTAEIADYIAGKYHLRFDITYINQDHPKEKKEAIYYKTNGGTKECPFLAAFDEGNEVVDALWGEVTQITQEAIDSFFKKFEQTKE